MKPLLITMLIVLIISTMATTSEAGWLIYHESELKGQIIDIDTKQPIEGAVVVVVYKTAFPNWPDGQGVSDIDVRETLTDKDGKFLIPSYSTIIQPLSWKIPGDVIVFKPGYASLTSLQGLRPSLFTGEKSGEREGTWHQSGLKYRLRDNGIVEIPKLETWKQRWRASNVSAGTDLKSKTTILNRFVNQEDENLTKIQRSQQ